MVWCLLGSGVLFSFSIVLPYTQHGQIFPAGNRKYMTAFCHPWPTDAYYWRLQE
jgi:hypothetical protein